MREQACAYNRIGRQARRNRANIRGGNIRRSNIERADSERLSFQTVGALHGTISRRHHGGPPFCRVRHLAGVGFVSCHRQAFCSRYLWSLSVVLSIGRLYLSLFFVCRCFCICRCSLRTKISRPHLPMSAEPFLVTDRAPRRWAPFENTQRGSRFKFHLSLKPRRRRAHGSRGIA